MIAFAKKWVRLQVLAALAEERTQRRAERLQAVIDPPDWREQDQHRLAEFLGTESGRTLIHRAKALHFNYAISGCAGGTPPGMALGWGEFLHWLEANGQPATNLSQTLTAPSLTATTKSTLAEPAGALDFALRNAP